MKKFKKLLLVLSVFTIFFTITGCGKEEKQKGTEKVEVNNIEGTLEELMTKVYEDLPEENTPMMLEHIEVTAENVENYLGTADIEFEEALAAESGIGAIAHSVVLVRAKDNADIEKLKTTIKENVNPRKWVCVGVEEEDVIIKNRGDLVILIMIQDEVGRTTIEKGFNNL